jgi:AcrR family transcriptional regulator
MAKTDMRQKIMSAAEKIFSSQGFHRVTMDMVAQSARVGKGTIYRYFQDKDDLFFQTATSGFDNLCEVLHRRVPEEASFQERLLEASVQISDFFEHRRRLFQIMQAEECRVIWSRNKLRERWLEKRARLVNSIAEILSQGVEMGMIRKDIPTVILAGYLLGLLRIMGCDMTDTPRDMKRLELLLDIFCHGASSA